VERANKTLQDRLVKELRFAGVSTMEDGNAFLPTFMADYNARFAKAPSNAKDLHRPMTPGIGWVKHSPGAPSGPCRSPSPFSTTTSSS